MSVTILNIILFLIPVQFDIDAAPKREKHKFKSITHSKGEDGNNKSNTVSKSEKVLKSANDSSKFYVPNSSDTVDSTPKKNSSINLENNRYNENKNNNLLNYQSLDNNAEYKSDIDADKLLENVLSAYSNSKYQDQVDNSVSFQGNESFNSNIGQSDEDASSKCNVDIQVKAKSGETSFKGDNSNGTQSSNENSIENASLVDSRGSKEEKVVDVDEVYSFHPTENNKLPETVNEDESMDSISYEESSSSSLDTKSNEPPKYGVDWVEYKAPELLLDLSVSSDHIFCVDVRNQMYFSKLPELGSLNWIELEQPADKVASSNSENVVWALYKGTVFAAIHKGTFLWENTKWVTIARDVVSIAVDDNSGW